MADETNEKPWPLMAISVITEADAERAGDGVDLLDAHLQMLYVTARKKLQEEGRMHELRRLTLVCHNEDRHIVNIVKD